MDDAPPPIEQMIAEGYASGKFSDDCWHRILAIVAKARRGVSRGLATSVADEVEGEAIEKIVRSLQSGLGRPPGEIAETPGLYDPARSFQAWCRTIVARCVSDVLSRRWTKDVLSPHGRPDGPASAAGGIPLDDRPDMRTPAPDEPLLRRERSERSLVVFEKAITRPRARIIVAVKLGYNVLLPDDVVRRWCDEAELDDIVDTLRDIAGVQGALFSLSELMPGMSYANVRAIHSRGMKMLEQAGFFEEWGGGKR